MATIKEDITLGYQPTTDAAREDTSFSAGDSVEVIQEWEAAGYVLIKDDDGHVYNIPADKLEA